MKKTITICDNCSNEYTTEQYGDEGVLRIDFSHTNSMTERFSCKMDLCSTCLSLVKESLNKTLKNTLYFKNQSHF